MHVIYACFSLNVLPDISQLFLQIRARFLFYNIYVCQWGASAVCPFWTPVQGLLLSGEREEASGLGRAGPRGEEGRAVGVDAPPLAPPLDLSAPPDALAVTAHTW